MIACTSLQDLPEVTSAQDDLLEKSWILKSLNEEDVNVDEYMRGLPKVKFRENGAFEGMTGCNSFTGKYAFKENLKLEVGAMTKMNCPGTTEADFVSAVENTSKLLMDGKELLFVKENEVLLRFKPEAKD